MSLSDLVSDTNSSPPVTPFGALVIICFALAAGFSLIP